MKRREKYQFSIAGQPMYPHLKLTRERFPRLLSTRILENDNAEYFGAFLTRSAARILIDFVNRTFRLRTCQIEIDGTFPVPCTQFYAKRCVAPCVKSLCDEERYNEIVGHVRLFLSNERERFTAAISDRIELASSQLDFERAALIRDIGDRVHEFWRDKKLRVWLDDTVDTLALEAEGGELKVYLVTQRGRRMLGMRIFAWPAHSSESPGQALHDVISQFYRSHAPREIRVSNDFPGRRELSQILSRKFGRTIKILVVDSAAHQVTTVRAMNRTRFEESLNALRPRKTSPEIGRDLKKIFGLPSTPRRIEAFDAAHISGTDLTAARSVWTNGRFLSHEYEAWFSNESNELETLRAFTEKIMTGAETLPDLILIDGGKSQLSAALKAIRKLGSGSVTAVGAVKPPGRHSEISHFVTAHGRRIEFNPSDEAMRILRILRDDAHDLANAAHRQTRDMAFYYELAGILPSLNENERQKLLGRFGSIKGILAINKETLIDMFGKQKGINAAADLWSHVNGTPCKLRPLVVPIRFDDPNGEAGDLRPIEAFR